MHARVPIDVERNADRAIADMHVALAMSRTRRDPFTRSEGVHAR